jgi:DNA-binding transcriptional LysR family regulator
VKPIWRRAGLLAELEDLDALLSQGASKASGRLRVTAPVSFGMRFLGRAIAGFQRQYPQVEVELSLNDRKVDLVEEGFDLAIRVSNLADSSLIARPLAKVRDRWCASPDYLLRHGVPQHPDELAQHDCLIYTLTSQPNLWEYQAPDGSTGRVRVKGSLRANNGDILTDAAIQGMGLPASRNSCCSRHWRPGSCKPFWMIFACCVWMFRRFIRCVAMCRARCGFLSIFWWTSLPSKKTARRMTGHKLTES